MILQQFNWLANQIMSIYKHIFVYIETLAVSKLIRQNKKKCILFQTHPYKQNILAFNNPQTNNSIKSTGSATNFLESLLNEVGLVDEPLLEVGQTLLLQLERLLRSEDAGVVDLLEEWGQVVHLLVLVGGSLLRNQPLLCRRKIV